MGMPALPGVAMDSGRVCVHPALRPVLGVQGMHTTVAVCTHTLLAGLPSRFGLPFSMAAWQAI
jgi:hypothetical protein